MPSKRKRQTTLSFSSLPPSSPASKDYNKQIRDRAAAVTLGGVPSSMSKKRKRGAQTTLPTPHATLEAQDDSDSEPIRTSQRRSLAKSSPLKPRASAVSSSNPRPPSSGMLKPRGRQSRADESDSSQDLPDLDGVRIHSSRTHKAIAMKQRRIDGGSESERNTTTLDEDEEDDMPTTMGIQRRKRRAASRSSLISSPPLSTVNESDDDLVIIDRPEAVESDENSDATPRTPSRRRLKRPRQMSQQEKDDLAEDLNFLEPSDSEKVIRSSQSAAKTAKQKALERLKRRRSGHPNSIDQDEDEGEDNSGDRDETAEGDYEVHEVDDDSDEPQIISSHQMFRKDKDDEDFLVEEDEEGPLGVPSGLPLAFTRFASMKPKELFKYAVEWFVQKKINPAFDMTDEIYDLTFKKLNDEVKGLAGSKFTSSAWTQHFTIALNARPDIAVDGSSGGLSLSDRCDACNRSGHPATFAIQFQGKPYHAETLEEVEAIDEDDSDSNSSSGDEIRPEYDTNGSQIPPESTIFNVGKFCTANAQTAHSLRHWRYHLNEWVVTWLIGQGYCSPARLLERDSWKTKKRRKYANKIVDRMAEEGVVKELWKNFKNNADSARNSKQGRYDAWSP